MSSANNLYTLADQELTRMHMLLNHMIEIASKSPRGSTGKITALEVAAVYGRIQEMQNIIFHGVATADPQIQAKIAEMALTGNQSK